MGLLGAIGGALGGMLGGGSKKPAPTGGGGGAFQQVAQKVMAARQSAIKSPRQGLGGIRTIAGRSMSRGRR